MNKFLKIVVFALFVVCGVESYAQKADKLLGVYAVVEEGRESKVRFTKLTDGTYQGQIFWLKNPIIPMELPSTI